MTLTLDTLREAKARMPRLPPPLVVTVDDRMTEAPREVCWVTFPKPSRHRSRRTMKKLLKRSARYALHAEPTMYRVGDRIVAHSALARRIQDHVRLEERKERYNPVFGGCLGTFGGGLHIRWPEMTT